MREWGVEWRAGKKRRSTMGKLKDEEYRSQDETEQVQQQITREGLPGPALHPEFVGAELPPSMDMLSDVELGNHLGMWASLYARVRWELAKAEGDQMVLQRRMGWVRSTELAGMAGDAKVTVQKARVEARDDMKGWSMELEMASIRVKLLDALGEGYRRKYDAVSREISRRESEKRTWGRDVGEGEVEKPRFDTRKDEKGEETSWSVQPRSFGKGKL